MVPLPRSNPPEGLLPLKCRKIEIVCPWCLMGLFIVSFFLFFFRHEKFVQSAADRSRLLRQRFLVLRRNPQPGWQLQPSLWGSGQAVSLGPLPTQCHHHDSIHPHDSCHCNWKVRNSCHILSCVAVSRLRLSIFYYVVLAKSCQVQVYTAKAIKTLHIREVFSTMPFLNWMDQK